VLFESLREPDDGEENLSGLVMDRSCGTAFASIMYAFLQEYQP
jgi:hypothetical protein